MGEKCTMELGEQLRAYRKRRRVTQRQLAAEVGCSAASICRRETGEIYMTGSELLKLCAAVERIVEGRNESAAPAEVLADAK